MISQSLKNLIEHLRGLHTVPVRLTVVHNWIQKEGIQDSIRFFEASFPSSVSRGSYRQFEAVDPAASPQNYSRILLPDNQNKVWRRFAMCKEMMHAFDPPEHKTSERERVIGVITNLHNYGFSLSSPEKRSLDEMADKWAIITSLVVLVPLNGIRDLVMKKIRDGELSIGQACNIYEIPQNHGGLVFASYLEEAAETILT